MILGIDTSCYTTSVALCHEGKILYDLRSPLKVKEGERGLRQSDGVFIHIKALPVLLEQLGKEMCLKDIEAVTVSTKPRPEEGSYMPVFTAGYSVAKSISHALCVPLYETSHQEGHIMAALESCGETVSDRFISVHISGGTTEVLNTTKTPSGFSLECIAGSLDLHAGQLIDRIGVSMGKSFPCGKELDSLALSVSDSVKLPVTLKGADFHLSGAEAQAMRLLEEGAEPGAVAKGVLECIGNSLIRSLDTIYEKSPFGQVLLGGGVSASKVLRNHLKSDKYKILFGDPKYSTDNACGVALIGDKLR